MVTFFNQITKEQDFLDSEDYHITEEWYGANDILEFELPVSHSQNKALIERLDLTVRDNGQTYTIVSKSSSSKSFAYKCELNLDEFKSDMYIGFHMTGTPDKIIKHVAPMGWLVLDTAYINTSETMELEGGTPYDIISNCSERWKNLGIRFDTAKKQILLVNTDQFQPNGVYATTELNLKENPSYSGNASGFYTRIWPIGKDGLTITSVNDGKKYLDNHDYDDRVISYFWKDERYTVPESLKAAAESLLKEHAVPDIGYSCQIADLARIDPEKYANFGLAVYEKITLLDKITNKQLNFAVTQRIWYPKKPTKGSIALNSVASKLSDRVETAYDSVTNPISDFGQRQQAVINNATNWITNGKGYMVAIKALDGSWQEICSLDTKDISTAKSVWRWNNGGFGHSNNGYNGSYSVAITQDGAIVANFITVGTLDCSRITVEHLSATSIDTGVLDAALITVKNLIADHVLSKNGNYSMELNASQLSLKSGDSYRAYIWVNEASPGQEEYGYIKLSKGTVNWPFPGHMGKDGRVTTVTPTEIWIGQDNDGDTQGLLYAHIVYVDDLHFNRYGRISGEDPSSGEQWTSSGVVRDTVENVNGERINVLRLI